MAKPRGIEHLIDYLYEYRDEYVVIGGGAAAVLMETQGLEFRSTKDIDIVLLTNGSTALNAKITNYIIAGQYQIKEASQEGSKYFRFRNPSNLEFPEIIEIFASNEQRISLNANQNIIPIQNDSIAKISAILLDDEYFSIIKENRLHVGSKTPVINALANICLKARAYRELSKNKEKGEAVDSKDISKHKKDILKLAVTLNGNEAIDLKEQAKSDMKYVLDELNMLEEKQFKVVMEKYPGVKKIELLKMLERIFLKDT